MLALIWSMKFILYEIYSFNTKWFRFSVRYSSLYWVYHKKYEKLPTNPPIHIYTQRINNRLIFKIKDGYKLELQIPGTRVPDLWLDMPFGPKLPQTSFLAPAFKCHSFDKVEWFFHKNWKKVHQKTLEPLQICKFALRCV